MTTNAISYLGKIDQLFRHYLAAYPQEADRLTVFGRQLAQADEKLTDRKNMIGHLTASALVIDRQDQCLLIYHRFLKRWLQPGGHLDAEEMPEEGALRELREETGLSALTDSILSLSGTLPLTSTLSLTGNGLVDIDSHLIPASITKQEGEHLHHDFQYIFRVEERGNIALDQGEVSDHKWVSQEDLGSGDYGQRLARVAGKLLKTSPDYPSK